MFKKCKNNLFSLQKTNFSADSVERPREFFVRENLGPCHSTVVAVLTHEQVKSASATCKIKPTMCVTPLSIAVMVLGTNEFIL